MNQIINSIPQVIDLNRKPQYYPPSHLTMFVQLQCCQKCFMHKQYRHSEWLFHDHFCKLDQTLQRKCKLKTLKNIQLPTHILHELEQYQFHEHQHIQQIINTHQLKINPQIQTFEIKYQSVYVFSLHSNQHFPDYNLIAKILLTLKNANPNDINILNKLIQTHGFLTLYELVKHKHQNTPQKNIKLKSIHELIPQKQFKRTQFSASKQKTNTQNARNRHLAQLQTTKNSPTSFEEGLFKEQPQNQYVFKLKEASQNITKPSTAQNTNIMGRGSKKVTGRGSTNMPLPKISAQQLAAKKRQQKRIRCKKFSNRYSKMTKKSDIINQLINSEYGRIKQEKYEFLSKESDFNGDGEYSQDFELQELSDSSEQADNIFKNCSNFSRISCVELLNELCKAEQQPIKYQQADTNNITQLQSVHSINKHQPEQSNQFAYQYDSRHKLTELDQMNDLERNLHSTKWKLEHSNNLLEAIRETEDDKWENNSFNSNVPNHKLIGKNSTHTSQGRNVNENIVGNNRGHKPLLQKHEQREETSKLKVNKSRKQSKSNHKDQEQGTSKQNSRKDKCLSKEKSRNSCLSQQPNNKSNLNQTQSQKFNQSQFLKYNKQPNCPLLFRQKQQIKYNIQPNQLNHNSIPTSQKSIHHQAQTQNQHSLLNINSNFPQPIPFEGSHFSNRFSFQSKNSQIQSQSPTKFINQNHLYQTTSKQHCSQQASPKPLFEGKPYPLNYQTTKDKSNQPSLAHQPNSDLIQTLNTFTPEDSYQTSQLYDYFSSNLYNFKSKISSFNQVKSPNSQRTNLQTTQKVEQFLSSVYPCPKILINAKYKKKISRIIQNFIDPYLELVEQSEKKQKQWVELTETNVCNIFLLQAKQTPKKVQTILWNRINPLNTKLYTSQQQDDIQTFIELGQLHKEYRQVLFLFYYHTFELHQLPLEIVSRKSAITQKEKSLRKYSFELKIGQKFQPESEQAKKQTNHIFIAFGTIDNQCPSSNPPNQVQEKQLVSKVNGQNEIQIKIQVYQKNIDQQLNYQGLIGKIEKKGKFFFQLNLQKGSYEFDVEIKGLDMENVKKRQLEFLFYSQAEVETSKVKEVTE